MVWLSVLWKPCAISIASLEQSEVQVLTRSWRESILILIRPSYQNGLVACFTIKPFIARSLPQSDDNPWDKCSFIRSWANLCKLEWEMIPESLFPLILLSFVYSCKSLGLWLVRNSQAECMRIKSLLTTFALCAANFLYRHQKRLFQMLVSHRSNVYEGEVNFILSKLK